MTLITAEKISKRFNDQIIVENLSFNIQSHDKIGLVGKNGSGKTTLFEMITSDQDADEGKIHISNACIVDYAKQEKIDILEMTLFDYVVSARQDILTQRLKIEELELLLEQDTSNKKAIEQLGLLHIEYEHAGGFNFENEIKIILSGLKFDLERQQDRIANFSGGEKNRAGLARVLAGNGNMLLLDEPTNHLDIESTKWLENYLQKTDQAYLVVSHDRMFLENCVNKIWEINNGRIDFYTGSFNKYLVERAERKRLQEHHYKHQQERIAQLEDFVQRNMAGVKTKQAQSKMKYLDRIKRLPPPESDGSGPSIKLSSSGRSYAQILTANNLTIGYGDTEVVSQIKFDVYRGDKIGVIGHNGSGKSTLLKTLIGEISPISGDLKLGNNVDVAYFDQELSDLDLDKTVLENMWEKDPIVDMGVMRTFLGKFGFSGEDALKKVRTLSGGEKTKLSLARLLYKPANFIIFDEPTNHLDIVSREALEDALINFEGTFLVVSHDRYFLDKVAQKIFFVNNSHLSIYEGNYSYFDKKQVPPVQYKVEKDSSSKKSYLSNKEKARIKSKHKKEFKSTEKKIAELEKEIEKHIDNITNNIPQSDWEKLQKTHDKKHHAEELLLTMYDRLEKLKEVELD